ncbi:DJ-1/PfpI family protein [Gluconobacter cerinus]|uniref:ThiJ family protein n=2 Tax=Gluconobacter cerinus TaxID=38307 RepID=A0AAV5NIP9_9PROT|nr:DJ-1/PfpI family protein [Gluconobacter cerinus]GLQ64255.1 ThiJ family protein [Gluconobacter cerinus]
MSEQPSHHQAVNLTRRSLAALTLASLIPDVAMSTPSAAILANEHHQHMKPMFAGPPLKVAMLVYPQMVLLDLVGPQTILKIIGCDIHLVWVDRNPVETDVGLQITPTDTTETCPQDLDVLFVPGGLMGSIACMNNQIIVDFLVNRAATSKYVTSVCTGSLVLAAAGLLRGYRATSHWGVVDILSVMGAIPSHERVVRDRNRITGAGVTAGLDFGLTLAAELRGKAAAEHAQLIIQYAPQPPFHHGDPSEISDAQMEAERSRRTWMDGKALEAAKMAAERI